MVPDGSPEGPCAPHHSQGGSASELQGEGKQAHKYWIYVLHMLGRANKAMAICPAYALVMTMRMAVQAPFMLFVEVLESEDDPPSGDTNKDQASGPEAALSTLAVAKALQGDSAVSLAGW